MKYFVILMTILYFFKTQAQSNWTTQDAGVSNDLLTVSVIDSNKVVIAGRDGMIIRTVNGGQTWSQLYSGGTDLNDIYFSNPNMGWIAGGPYSPPNFGVILKTDNGGVSWTQKYFQHSLFSIHFISDSVGWAGGYHILLKTTDGGNTWQEIDVSNIIAEIYSIYFTSPDTGWVAGELTVYKTINGGINWEQQHPVPPAIGSVRYFSINGFDSDTLWICGYRWDWGNESAILYNSSNSGQTWSRINIPLDYISSFYLFNNKIGWCVGSGKIIKTIDRGTSWTVQHNSSMWSLNDIDFADSTDGYVVGNQGTIIRTCNGGGSWTGLFEGPETSVLKDFYLYQNYPNPFNQTTNIEFSIPKAEFVSLKIYNLLGQEVVNLVSENLKAGFYKYDWDAGSLACGIYIYRLQTEKGAAQSKKLVLLK